jgi:glycine cleavage system H protein
MVEDRNEQLRLTVDKFTFQFPRDLHYSEAGLWISLEGGLVRVGLFDFARQRSGDIAFANLVQAGTALDAGNEVASIETVKVNISLPTPIGGIVLEVHTILQESPELINQEQ